MTDPVTPHDLELCIALCRRHLEGLQTGRGNFLYEYNWETGVYSAEDNAVRQAGTLWGLANLFRLRPDPSLLEVCRRGLAFYEARPRAVSRVGRFATYPGERHSFTGSTALVALAVIELLRSRGVATGNERARWQALLDEYLAFLVAAQRRDGRWPARHDAATGEPSGEPSPYFDGETLLALTRAARHLGCPGLDDAIARGAAAGYRHYVLLALRRTLRSRQAIGYYQWGTMAMYEMIMAGWGCGGQYREAVAYLGEWMCGFQDLARRRGNPAASLEGLIHAYDLAAATGDEDHRRRFRAVIRVSLRSMLSLQVGHPLAGAFVRRAPPTGPAPGGCQHWPDRPLLRIDFAQHQLHACMLAAELFRFEPDEG